MVPPRLPTVFIAPLITPALRRPTSRQTAKAILPVISWQTRANDRNTPARIRSPVRATAISINALPTSPIAPRTHLPSLRLPDRFDNQSVAQPPNQNAPMPNSHGIAENNAV